MYHAFCHHQLYDEHNICGQHQQFRWISFDAFRFNQEGFLSSAAMEIKEMKLWLNNGWRKESTVLALEEKNSKKTVPWKITKRNQRS
ncbi:hypothetical protein AVEN_56224-1 [Araneus ventricosus]|uniref:Uncharacterized protein n=1 Tax=Araneus ventricosus TaxID=182803 RepID=A0A4Y2J2W0_ARAVE|nr:hypothetical protein AVEN_56224-1 [Araneus ventricosus]